MLRIGDFSRLSRVSIRMLRYYDETGLLKPDKVDDFTGYRYYNEEQLLKVGKINALKIKDFFKNRPEFTTLLRQMKSSYDKYVVKEVKYDERKNYEERNGLCIGWGLLHTGFEVGRGRTSYWKVWTYASRVFKGE